MKKSVVAGLVLLALIVIISPGLMGYLAERSVDKQLEWAADDNQEIVISAAGFERGWFFSEGEHRVEFASTGPGAALRQQLGFAATGTPALIINTRLDHGLIPVSSMNRDEGSLLPGLGRAISHLSIENADGEVSALPGVVYTQVGLTGAVSSHYILEPGAVEETSWGAADITVKTSASQDTMEFEGQVDALRIAGGNEQLETGDMQFSGALVETGFGFSVGDLALTIASVGLKSAEQSVRFEPLSLRSHSRLSGGRVDGDMDFDISINSPAQPDAITLKLHGNAADIDGAAFGRLLAGLKKARRIEDPMQAYALIENDLQTLFEKGFEIDIDTLNLELPEGTMRSSLTMAARESAANPLARTGLLLALEARADVSIPAGLFDYIAARNPGFLSAAAMGFLRRNGDNYELAAEYKKGLLTVNGAPMPIPLPGR